MSAPGESIEEEYVDDGSETVSGRTYNLLKGEFEKCRQQVHDLRRKVCLDEAMLRELREANESLERQRLSEKEEILLDMEERHRAVTKEYESAARSLERRVTVQAAEIEQLRRNVKKEQEDRAPIPDQSAANIALEEDNVSLKARIDQLLLLLEEEKEKYYGAERAIEELKNQCTHYQDICRIVKEQLAEKTTALEDARAELILKRGEAVSEPGQDFSKGNSLFAEVEDRRRCMMGKMNALREKYAQAKRLCQAQAAEIKSLRTERASTLEKWENDAVHAFAETDRLIHKYKSRITDLEAKLKFQIQKNDQKNDGTNPNDASFGYFQSLLDAKKKEANELRMKIEDLSTRLLIQEETKINDAKQLQYWRCKASSLEARMFAGNVEARSTRTDCSDKFDFIRNHEDDGVGIEETTDRKSESDEKAAAAAAAAARIGKIEIPESECIKKEEKAFKLPTKMLRFARDTNTEEESSEFREPATNTRIEYPMVYVNTDS